MVLAAVGALIAGHALRREPIVTLRIETKSFARSGCGWSPPYHVELRSKGGTPVSGNELTLEVTASNSGGAGPFDCWVYYKPGTIEPLDGPLRWIKELKPGETRTWTARVRILANQPIDLTGKMRSMETARTNQPSAETYLRLFPFEVRDGVVTAQWDQETMRPLSEPKRPRVKLPNGDIGVVYAAGAPGN